MPGRGTGTADVPPRRGQPQTGVRIRGSKYDRRVEHLVEPGDLATSHTPGVRAPVVHVPNPAKKIEREWRGQ